MAVTIVPSCQKCDEELEVSRVYVEVDEDCFLLHLETLCVACGAQRDFRWTLESLVKWAYDNTPATEKKPAQAVVIRERKRVIH